MICGMLSVMCKFIVNVLLLGLRLYSIGVCWRMCSKLLMVYFMFA